MNPNGGTVTNVTDNPVCRAVGGVQMAVNVTADSLCCTLNTRYNDMALPKDILSLRHFPKTVVLVWYD